MAESEHDDHTSPERDDQINNKKKKLRKRKRSRKLEQEVEKEQEEENENTESEVEKNDDTVQQQGEEDEDGEDGEEEKKEEIVVSSGIMSTESFSSLGLSQPTSKSIMDMGFNRMTQVTHFLLVFSIVFNFNNNNFE